MSLETLFENFQGRKVTSRKQVNLEDKLPVRMYPFGTALNVMYKSDKRDPGDSQGDGRQGVWKLFTHEHGADVTLYCCEPEGAEDGWEVDWPESCAWLGKLTELRYLDETGTEITETVTNMDLWVWEDDRIMMALSRNLSKLTDVIIWKGGRLRVEGRGIVK